MKLLAWKHLSSFSSDLVQSFCPLLSFYTCSFLCTGLREFKKTNTRIIQLRKKTSHQTTTIIKHVIDQNAFSNGCLLLYQEELDTQNNFI